MQDKNLIAQGLKKLKDRHNITIEDWSEKSGVPAGTIARYLSSSLNIPNFPYVCAMIKCLGESIDAFFEGIDDKIAAPVDALKLDAVPAAVVGDIPVDTPESKKAIQERIIIQTEDLQAQRALVREKESTIELLEAKLEMAERIIEEKDRTIASIEDISKRRLQAIQALCMAQ
jgi:transcriptional regulator with XRE-family HTH domain